MAEEYDRFLGDFAGTPLIAISEGIYAGLLGTYEHNIRNRERNEDDWSWILTLERDISEDTMLFATAATGTKGGGFDGRFLKTNDNPYFEYDEEQVLGYELGVKSHLFDGRMTLNATAFMSTIEDYQASIFDGATSFFVRNAAEIETKGIEFDAKWAATEGLVISFAGSYLDNQYTDFPNAPCWTNSGSEPINRGDCVDRGTIDAHRNAKGESNIASPKWAYNLNFDYRLPVGNTLEARAVFNINYADQIVVAGDLDPIYASQDSYTKYDVRLSLGSTDAKWDIALIGKNLSDELIGNGTDQPLNPGNGYSTTDRPRSYSLQATYRF